ncbi:nucleoside-diphosphate-sugar epimerase [Thiogranum longum]|uniref:Nucleoside-diphosphate-sugar epimerase n=1 Tax=Thiogranum longum TaxID=1537524 RepID=A0A4V2PGT2_9GAMM|nr:NAD(P)-dependent oxidoreductase [Thiogranum longum]TCK18036.1 nucleoside-diphosphate-sugar epimerase [Thiogranum longum]
METLNVLVTGANGFVGSHILEALMKKAGVKPVAACRDRRKLLPAYDGEIREGDLQDKAYLETLLDNIDVVCHAAAWTSAWGYRKASEQLFYQPTKALIEQLRKSNVSRFIFLSSTSVAAPYASQDPMSRADESRLKLWPHMRNVARIENHMRDCDVRGCTMISLRTGLFAGRRYGIGLLSLLVPRLKTHLVPWVSGGKTGMPLIAGDDIGEAFALTATATGLEGYQGFNIVGPTVPTAREVIGFLNESYQLPTPHFSVPFAVAYPFARSMELLDPVMPREPLVTRSIIHLLEETGASNTRATEKLGYQPKIHWKEAIRMQMNEMATRQQTPMKMCKPIPS